jgi:hypothetical protein
MLLLGSAEILRRRSVISSLTSLDHGFSQVLDVIDVAGLEMEV